MRLLIFLLLPFAVLGQWAPSRPLGYSETHRQLSDFVSNFNRKAYGAGSYEAPTPPVAAPLPQEYYQRSTTPSSSYKPVESSRRTFPAQFNQYPAPQAPPLYDFNPSTSYGGPRPANNKYEPPAQRPNTLYEAPPPLNFPQGVSYYQPPFAGANKPVLLISSAYVSGGGPGYVQPQGGYGSSGYGGYLPPSPPAPNSYEATVPPLPPAHPAYGGSQSPPGYSGQQNQPERNYPAPGRSSYEFPSAPPQGGYLSNPIPTPPQQFPGYPRPPPPGYPEYTRTPPPEESGYEFPSPPAPSKPGQPTVPEQPQRPSPSPPIPGRPEVPVAPTPGPPHVPEQPERPPTPPPTIPEQPQRPEVPGQPRQPPAPQQPPTSPPSFPGQPQRPSSPSPPQPGFPTPSPPIPEQPTPGQPQRPSVPGQPEKPGVPEQPQRPPTPQQPEFPPSIPGQPQRPSTPAPEQPEIPPSPPTVPGQPPQFPPTSPTPPEVPFERPTPPPGQPIVPGQPQRPEIPSIPPPGRPQIPGQPEFPPTQPERPPFVPSRPEQPRFPTPPSPPQQPGFPPSQPGQPPLVPSRPERPGFPQTPAPPPVFPTQPPFRPTPPQVSQPTRTPPNFPPVPSRFPTPSPASRFPPTTTRSPFIPGSPFVPPGRSTVPPEFPPTFGTVPPFRPNQLRPTPPRPGQPFVPPTAEKPPPTQPPQGPMVPNRIRGKAHVICEENGMDFNVKTIFPFTGQIFAHDRKRNPNCVHSFRNEWNIDIKFSYAECGIKNAGTEKAAQTQFHLQIIVMFEQADGTTTVQSFMAQCFEQKINYNKQQVPKRIEEALEELKLVPAKLEQKAPLPTTEMRIVKEVEHHGEGDGEETSNVDIGQPLRIEWSLKPESDAYGFIVKDCYVEDAVDGSRHQVIDERGCSVDLNILGHPHYDTYHDIARTHWHAFKVPDSSQLSIKCNVQICTDIADSESGLTSCDKIPTPPFCPDLVTSPSNSILFDVEGNLVQKRDIRGQKVFSTHVHTDICFGNTTDAFCNGKAFEQIRQKHFQQEKQAKTDEKICFWRLSLAAINGLSILVLLLAVVLNICLLIRSKRHPTTCR